MTIEVLQPRLEALIQQRMVSGQFETIEDALLHALESAPLPELQEAPKRQNLADFLMNSPLRGSGLEAERLDDSPRPVEL